MIQNSQSNKYLNKKSTNKIQGMHPNHILHWLGIIWTGANSWNSFLCKIGMVLSKPHQWWIPKFFVLTWCNFISHHLTIWMLLRLSKSVGCLTCFCVMNGKMLLDIKPQWIGTNCREASCKSNMICFLIS